MVSQQALADKARLSIETISHIERKTTSTKVDTLEVLARALGVQMRDFFLEAGGEHVDASLTRILAAARTLKAKELEIAVMQIEALAHRRRE